MCFKHFLALFIVVDDNDDVALLPLLVVVAVAWHGGEEKIKNKVTLVFIDI